MQDDWLTFSTYEVGKIVNENRYIVLTTNDLEEANEAYEYAISKCNTNDHNIVFLYDYNKNANINYYDNLSDVC